ncbi:MAG: isoleucine--tRNA ligase [Candidatus Woesearchaeota archaeon]|nr:isoleucine--tRNA ligase [Candidatus Woesearchaeota archaeon]
MLKNYNFREVEENTLKFWKEKKIYEKAKEKNRKGKIFYFLDGPPYTSGRVHIGTAWNKSLKDCFIRFKRMNGFNIWDRAGYDMHGLPTEHKVEEKLGIKQKEDIVKFGVEKFIKECKTLSTENMKLMNDDFIRLGIWMDFENAYQSLKNEFIEGEWWLIKRAHENKRLYEGLRTMTWCGHCETALAKHELEYETVEDDSIFLKFKVKDKPNEYLVIWTTTPWTIPFNLAVMVNPELDYVRAKVGSEVWIVAKGLAGAFIGGVANKDFTILEEFKGNKLEGTRYEHPLYKELKNVYDELEKESLKVHSVILSSEYVDLSAGSGLVHCAPGCGPEDYEVGHKNEIKPFNNLSERGEFPKEMGIFAGLIAKKDDKKFIEALEEANSLIATTKVEHEYAHCWRCHNPVIYKTTKQWFFEVEDLKEKMIEANKKIKWVPEAAFNAFESWLKNLRDNSITKQRYWGCPLPVWKCEKCNDYVVIGSANELKALANKVPEDLHKPYIDEVTIKCSCGGIKKRIPDILDVWVDAGTTSWSCLDYPQRKDLFEKMFPPEFILEGKDQIRGWFNLLMVASFVSMNRPSFKAVYMHGFVQDALGRKMSKSLGNQVSPYEVIEKYGADTLRYYMICGANPGVDINYNFDDLKIKNKNLFVLWNLANYMVDLAQNSGINPSKITAESVEKNFEIEEKYIFSKLNSTIKKVTGLFEEYRLNEVPLAIEELYLELSRTYVQLVRDKFSGEDNEKKVILFALYENTMHILKMFAAVAPFISEQIYLNLKEAFGLNEESIHLFDWPVYDKNKINAELENDFSVVKDFIQSILAGREKISLGVRWPLKEVILIIDDEKAVSAVEKLEDAIKKQTNVKELKIQKIFPQSKTIVKADFNKLGPAFGNKVPKIIAKLSTESAENVLSHIKKEGKFVLKVDNESINLLRDHIVVTREVPFPFKEVEFRYGQLYLNAERNDELEAEGYSREIMRRVQEARKKNGLEKKDRIVLFVKVDEDLKEMLAKWEDAIKEKCGADKIKISDQEPARKHNVEVKESIKGKEIRILFDKIV